MFQMPMLSERNGPVAESKVASVRLVARTTECESSVSWIRIAPCTEWVRSCLKGPTGDGQSTVTIPKSQSVFRSLTASLSPGFRGVGTVYCSGGGIGASDVGGVAAGDDGGAAGVGLRAGAAMGRGGGGAGVIFARISTSAASSLPISRV